MIVKAAASVLCVLTVAAAIWFIFCGPEFLKPSAPPFLIDPTITEATIEIQTGGSLLRIEARGVGFVGSIGGSSKRYVIFPMVSP